MDKSVDSIGSCSLDIEADSTDFSDTSESLNLLTSSTASKYNQEFTSRIRERIAYPKSDGCDYLNHEKSSENINRENIKLSPSKKPSYLNLACSVSGYSNITTYDSKLRQDINRSREVSPVRPITHTIQYTKSDCNNFLLVPIPVGNKLLLPDYSNGKTMDDVKESYMSPEKKMFTASMLHESSGDVTDDAGIHHKSTFSETAINTCYSATSVKLLSNSPKSIGNGALIENLQFSSPSKSFIQQRVERLYGPGALAQSFFIKKQPKTYEGQLEEMENIPVQHFYSKISNGTIDENATTGNSPGLPVFRHLRPEFRAQLPMATLKKSPTTNLSRKVRPDEEKIELTRLENISANYGVLNGKSVEGATLSTEGIKDLSINEENLTTNGKGHAPEEDVRKNGNYFLMLLNIERDRLLSMADTTEKEIILLQKQKSEVSDEVFGYLRSAAGKARLLATQKMQQFEGLCHKNLSRQDDDPFPTTCEDLEGFWDMVLLQVASIDSLYTELGEMRNNNWCEIQQQLPNLSVKSLKLKKPGCTKSYQVPIIGKLSQNVTEAALKRDLQRKKFMETKRQAVRNKTRDTDNGVEVFVPRS